MLPEFGLFFLILALLVASLQASYLMPAAQKFVAPCLPAAAWLQSLLITLAFATLMILRLESDFSVINVIQHSNLTLPTLYKIAGTWGNHEGSMLLWVWVLAVFGLALSRSEHSSTIQTAIAVQALLCVGFLLFILCTSNPFARIFPPMADGEALNPLLQDIGLAMHPPLLYLGYVGFSIVFSLAVAALLQGNMKRGWAELVHPWILAAWSALTIGIGLGSWWAYRVLGWGGFWFWDPVENASLLPWLSGTALLHSNYVLRKRGMLKSWVILLSIITFGLSLLGTFLTRSGVLISVHSFASDPARGIFILGYITVVLGGALLLFALRAGQMESQEKMLPLSREGMIVINNLFLLTACATVLLGTLYPMIMQLTSGTKLTVGAPYFNAIALPLLAIPLIFAGLAPFMPWQHAPLRQALRQAKPAMLAALAAMLLVLAVAKIKIVLGMLGMGLSMWLIVASLRWLKQRADKHLSVFLGHFGAAVVVAGITGMGLWQQEFLRPMKIGDSTDVAGYHAVYTKESTVITPNYHGWRDEFSVSKNGKEVAQLSPEYRIYDIAKSPGSVAAVDYGFTRDIYIAIAPSGTEGIVAVRLYYNPMIGFIWTGCLLMAIGGIMAIFKLKL